MGPSVVSLLCSWSLRVRRQRQVRRNALCSALACGDLSSRCTTGNAGVAMALVLGVVCRWTGPEESVGPSFVSLVLSLVSESPAVAPGWAERIVFRVGLWESRLAVPREMRDC